MRAGLEEVAREYGAEEVMVVTITHDHAARRRSYELIAEAFAGQPFVAESPRFCDDFVKSHPRIRNFSGSRAHSAGPPMYPR